MIFEKCYLQLLTAIVILCKIYVVVSDLIYLYIRLFIYLFFLCNELLIDTCIIRDFSKLFSMPQKAKMPWNWRANYFMNCLQMARSNQSIRLCWHLYISSMGLWSCRGPLQGSTFSWKGILLLFMNDNSRSG